MSIFDSDSKQRKQDQIALQNIVLDINEKKLQVSEDFLIQMTKIYISRYMKIVNDNVADLGNISNIANLFRKYDNAITNIDYLIQIEGLYRFKRPFPSEYKIQLQDSLPTYVNSLIAREWKKTRSANSISPDDANDPHKYDVFFETFSLYENKMPESSLKMLQKLHDSVYPKEEIHLSPTNDGSTDDGFVEEQFERIPDPTLTE